MFKCSLIEFDLHCVLGTKTMDGVTTGKTIYNKVAYHIVGVGPVSMYSKFAEFDIQCHFFLKYFCFCHVASWMMHFGTTV